MSKPVSINRSQPFDPEKFLGEGWKIAEQDERSLALDEIDLTKIQFETCLKPNESRITGEEKLKRLKKDGHIRLDAKIFQTLWENQHLIPEKWKEKINNNICFIFFDGTVLQGPGGDRNVLFLYWHDGGWHWDYSWLERAWHIDDPSAVLASI
ncbi:hypothetical protein KJ763_02290 [Patescibacteria group bacterium]|nr:hypothetical protein [Patescibacteria group bacterium]